MNSLNKLQAFRRAKGLTQEEFAQRLGFTFSMVSKVENGAAKPSRNFMERVKQTFPDADINALFFGADK